jgi:hypothetical protein
MMKFREFLKKRRGNALKYKGEEQSTHQHVDTDNQGRDNDKRVPIGADPNHFPPAAIPPRVGETG